MNYTINLRKRVIDFVIKENNSMRSASKIFNAHYNTVKKWVKIFKRVKRDLQNPFSENWQPSLTCHN